MGGSPLLRRHFVVVCFCVGILGTLAFPPAASAYTFGQGVSALGPEEVVFDWATERCEEWDIPDQPARAFRDDQGRVQLHFSHHDARRNVGTDLNTASDAGSHDCGPFFQLYSTRNPDASKYEDYEWLSAPYTLNGRTVYSLVHSEYRGWLYGCVPPSGDVTKCWYNTVTLATSTNSGDQFTHAAAPNHLVASMPDRWVDQTGPYGVFTPSNIVKKQPDDGYYYSIVRSKEPGAASPVGSCVMRTSNLADPDSWRAWDGTSYSVRFIDPYLETPSPNRAAHVCKQVNLNFLGGASDSLTYNTHFGKFLIVGAVGDFGPQGAGFYYSLSDNLVNWSVPKLLVARETAQSHQCGDPDPVRDPSLLDPASTSRNFETTGQRPYLYYKVMHMTQGPGCYAPPDRDQIRIPIEFDAQNQSPSASFTVTPNPAQTGQSVTFDGSASSDPDGQITNHMWDLDGNGTFELDTGSAPTTTRSYASAGTLTVKLRVKDAGGATADTTRSLTVNAPQSTSSSTQAPAAPAPTAQTRSQAPAPDCATARKKRARLVRARRTARRKLARARTRAARRHYTSRIKSLNRKIKRLQSASCPR